MAFGEYKSRNRTDNVYRRVFVLAFGLGMASLVLSIYAAQKAEKCLGGDIIPNLLHAILTFKSGAVVFLFVFMVILYIDKEAEIVIETFFCIGLMFFVSALLCLGLGWVKMSDYTAKTDAKCLNAPPLGYYGQYYNQYPERRPQNPT